MSARAGGDVPVAVDEPISFPVERSKVAELAESFHDDAAIWRDRDAALAAGFADAPVLPTTTTILDHWRPGGALGPAEALGFDLARVLHGEVSWDYLVPVRVGDRLTATVELTDVRTRTGRRGGEMTLATAITTFVNQRGEVAVRRRDTVIETGEEG